MRRADGHDSSFFGLPDVLREIAEVAGLEAATKLAWGYGGTIVKIPRKVGPKHWLVDCVGRKAADAICNHFRVIDADGRAIGNFKLQVPLGDTGVLAQVRRRLAEELQSGKLSVPAAARKCGVHERTAWRMKAKLQHPGNGTQGDLFDPTEP